MVAPIGMAAASAAEKGRGVGNGDKGGGTGCGGGGCGGGLLEEGLSLRRHD